jgi:Ni/Fe-hydrogenase subunit HybB-like protein
MLERIFRGGRQYWTLVGIFSCLILLGVIAFTRQFTVGLAVTGMSRDVPWGLYIAQLTFLVGVAASAVMVVLPYYLHDYKAFGRMTILGEFLAIPAVFMCMLFVMVDIGQPMRALNIVLYPTPNSMLFWDLIALSGYLLLNVVISMVTFGAERKGVAPPKWIKPVIILSIPWAVSIHTVTAFLYSGLAGRPFWLTAILAPRFLASAFASGPSLLIILCLIVRKYTKFDPGKEAIQALARIVTYAMVINIFFVGVELFTALYSDIPEHVEHFRYLFLGLEGHHELVPFMWTSQALAVTAVVLLLFPRFRRNEGHLLWICIAVVTAVWIEKGLGMVITGFIPNPLGEITTYWPTFREMLITVGIYGTGFLVLTGLYKIAISVREEIELT